MQLNPRYGPDPVITLDGSPAAIAEPAIRQRQRFVAMLGSLTEEQWGRPSRCAGWSNRDVVVHLDSTNAFWAHSIDSGVRGDPTRLLASFDPVTSPAEFVAAGADLSADEVLESFTASTEGLVERWATLDGADWSKPAEAPPGHLSISAVSHHALWDSWVHERDVLLPMGAAPEEHADEVAACLRYVAALGPAVAINRGAQGAGVLEVAVTDPDLTFGVAIDEHRAAVRAGPADDPSALTGDAVELVEALSLRAPLDQEVPPGLAPMFAGLTEAFDTPNQPSGS